MTGSTSEHRNACRWSPAILVIVGLLIVAFTERKPSYAADEKPSSTTKPAAKDAHDHAHGEKGEPDEHGEEVKLAEDAVKRYGIKVESVKKRALIPTFTAPARVVFNLEQMAHVGSAVRGRIAELKVRIGDSVKKGDVLLIVNSPELGEAQSDFLQKKIMVLVAEPNIELARKAMTRAQQLLKENQSISVTEVQKREMDYQAAKGALLTAQAAVTGAENKLHLLGMSQEAISALEASKEIDPGYIIRARIDGQVVEREVTLDELVSPDKESLMILASLNTIWVQVDVPEFRLNQVAKGAKVRLKVTARNNEVFEGVVSHISPQLDPNTRTARVRVEVDNQSMKLMPGMFASAEITAPPDDASFDAVLAIPEEAVLTVEGKPSVFVAVEGEENTFAKRPVALARPVGGWMPVISGVRRGEKIVTAGTFILKAELGKSGAAHEH